MFNVKINDMVKHHDDEQDHDDHYEPEIVDEAEGAFIQSALTPAGRLL